MIKKFILLSMITVACVLSSYQKAPGAFWFVGMCYAQSTEGKGMMGEIPIERTQRILKRKRGGTRIQPEVKEEIRAQIGTKADDKDKSKKEEKKKTPKLHATTKKDYSYYTKSGHRSSKWNNLILPGFQSFDSGSLSTSFIFLQKAYDKGCRDPLVLFRLAIYKESMKQYANAAQFIKEAVEKVGERYPTHPLNKAIHKHAGRALYNIGDINGALVHISEALKYEPDDFMLLFMAGQLLNQKGNPSEAREMLESALVVSPPADVGAAQAIKPLLHELMAATFNMKDYKACKSYAEQMIALDPTDRAAHDYKYKAGTKLRWDRETKIIKELTR